MLEARAFAAVLLVATGLPASATPVVGVGINSDAVVDKTVFSDNMRLVFAMGLEGAGHHYILRTRNGIFEEHPDSAQFEKGFPSSRNFYLPALMSESSTVFDQKVQSARDEMIELARLSESLPSPTFHLLGGGTSFPCAHGPQKVMQYADPRLMAEAAEAGGVDFRILYLKRSARDLLIADTLHRDFPDHLSDPQASSEHKFMEYARVLFTNIAVVHSFLGELDPAFIVCHDFALLGDEEQATRIANFVAPDDETAAIITEALVGSVHLKHASNDSLPFDVNDSISRRMQLKLDVFEDTYCGQSS